mgnify:CR=1 FL=1
MALFVYSLAYLLPLRSKKTYILFIKRDTINAEKLSFNDNKIFFFFF